MRAVLGQDPCLVLSSALWKLCADRRSQSDSTGTSELRLAPSQGRRLALISQYVDLEGKRILDVGCGLGMYVKKFRQYSDEVYGVDIDSEKVALASTRLPNIVESPAEVLPVPGRDVRRHHAARGHRARRRRSGFDPGRPTAA